MSQQKEKVLTPIFTKYTLLEVSLSFYFKLSNKNAVFLPRDEKLSLGNLACKILPCDIISNGQTPWLLHFSGILKCSHQYKSDNI